MAIRSTSTNIDIGNATTETGTQRPPTVTSTPGKAEALLGLRTRKTYFTLAFDLELTDGLALPTSMPMPGKHVEKTVEKAPLGALFSSNSKFRKKTHTKSHVFLGWTNQRCLTSLSSFLEQESNSQKFTMSIYLSRSFPRSNSSFQLSSGNALQSEVVRLREEKFLVDAGPGTPRMCMQDEPTGVPINRAARFENKVGSQDVVAGESLIKEQILERFFIDVVAGDSKCKERAAARFNSLVGSTDVVAGEPLLLLPRRFRQRLAWMELNKIWRRNRKVKGFILQKVKGGFLVGIGGFITFLPFRRISNGRFTILSINLKGRRLRCSNSGRSNKNLFLSR